MMVILAVDAEALAAVDLCWNAECFAFLIRRNDETGCRNIPGIERVG
jgi:hypothetical protein